jgi:23S rRNA pseudouridine1911/1915/1917 synthase
VEIYTFTPDEEQKNLRIDKFLSEQLPDQSRSYLQKLLKEGNVTVNEKTVKANYKVQLSDTVKLELPEPECPDILPEDIPLDILYEDEDVLIINKPKGMVVHPSAGHYTHTVVNAVMFHCKEHLSGINGVMRPGIVHRIDMDTTGAIVICKNDMAHQSLAKQLKDKTNTREYVALVHGNIKEDSGTIDAPLGRSKVDRKKQAVVKDGRNAVTHFEVLKRYGDYTLVKCVLETGRTHQIRVHMKYIGHPLVGDQLYGPRKTLGNSGQFLHAEKLGFIHPRTNEYLEFTAPLPENFKKLLESLDKR